MERRSILVPHDFTAVGDNALQYAINLANIIQSNVDILHVVKDEKDRSKAAAQCDKIIAALKDKPQDVAVNYHIKSGTIFTDIASKASELKSSLIIMGTHGAVGMQKLFGSFAIKVITSTQVPFLVVQQKYTGSDLSKIIVPLDESQESLQIEQVTSGLALLTKSEIHIVTAKQIDVNLKLKNAVHSGLISKQFKDKGLKYVATVLPKEKGYSSDIVSYAVKEKANLIAFAYHSDSLLPQFDKFAQNLITNTSGVPVLIMNSKEAGNYFF